MEPLSALEVPRPKRESALRHIFGVRFTRRGGAALRADAGKPIVLPCETIALSERNGPFPRFAHSKRGSMQVRAFTRFLIGFVGTFVIILWGEWMPHSDYVISEKGWIVSAGIGGLFAALPRLWE